MGCRLSADSDGSPSFLKGRLCVLSDEPFLQFEPLGCGLGKQANAQGEICLQRLYTQRTARHTSGKLGIVLLQSPNECLCFLLAGPRRPSCVRRLPCSLQASGVAAQARPGTAGRWETPMDPLLATGGSVALQSELGLLSIWLYQA